MHALHCIASQVQLHYRCICIANALQLQVQISRHWSSSYRTRLNLNRDALFLSQHYAVLSFELQDMTHGSTESPAGVPQYDPVVLKVSKFTVKMSQLRYITFTLIGIALLWPWNCFLSALAYYGKRFANTASLVRVYSSTMMSVSTITSTAYNYYLSQVQRGVNYTHRVYWGMGINVAVFMIMSWSCVSYFFIDMADATFFTILMIMVFMSSLATCLAQNGTMALVNVLGSIYANAMMVGQAVAGVLPAIALILSILLVGETKTTEKPVEKDYGVFLYYITASLVAVTSIGLLWLVTERKESGYQSLDLDEGLGPDLHIEVVLDLLVQDLHTGLDTGLAPLGPMDLAGPEPSPGKVPFSTLWAKLKLIVLSIFLTFSITLIFPVFASTVESVHPHSQFKLLQKEIFIPFIYLIWNLGDLLGRIWCGMPNSKLLIRSPRVLIAYALARLVFIPLFFTCNIGGASSGSSPAQNGASAALIPSDLWYVSLQLLFGLSNGQLCTSCFMIVGDFCDTDEEKEAAGGFTAVFLSIGLAVGSVLSYLLVMAM